MTDIGEVTVKELTEYADYCMGKIPVDVRSRFPGEMRGITVEVRRKPCSGVESVIIDAGSADRSFIIDIYDSDHRRVMAGRIWLNNGYIYLVDWDRFMSLYDESPYGIETFEEFKSRRTLPVVPKGILKIPSKL